MKKLFVAMVLTAFMAACGSAPKPVAEAPAPKLGGECDVPAWYPNVPEDSNYFYARGTSTGKYLEDAQAYAAQSAKATLAFKLQDALEASLMQRREELDKAIGTEVDRSQWIKEAVDIDWRGAEPSPEHYYFCRESDGTYAVYLLARVPQKQLLIDLAARIKEKEYQKDLFKEKVGTEVWKRKLREFMNTPDHP